MHHHHSESHLRRAIVALQDSDGYVDALLGLARDQIVARRPSVSHKHLPMGFHSNREAMTKCGHLMQRQTE